MGTEAFISAQQIMVDNRITQALLSQALFFFIYISFPFKVGQL